MFLNYYYRIIIWLFISLGQVACNSQGHGGISGSIEESNSRNVFTAEYEVKHNPYVINDTLKLNVKKAWVENRWAYGQSTDETIIIQNCYQLVIEVDSDILLNYGLTWRIGIDGNHYIRSCGKKCLIADFNRMPKDMEEWKVQNGWKLDSSSNKTIIGNFQIFKKKF